MDGLHELTGSGVPLSIGGQTYHLLPLRAMDWGEAARYLNARRKSPLEIVKDRLAGLAEPMQRHLLELAYRDERDGDFLSMAELQKWFCTPEGAAYKLWLTLRRNHTEVTLEMAGELMRQATDEEAITLARTDHATSGLPEGNSFGRS